MKVIKRKKTKVNIQLRIIVCAVLLLGFCLIIGGNLFRLQVIQSGALAKRVDMQSEEDRKLQSPRGTILDRNGKVLAISEIAKSLYADPTMLNRSPEEMAQILAPYVDLKPAEIQERLERDTAFVWLQRTMDHEKYEALQERIHQEDIKGLAFIDESCRSYPNGNLAAQLVGFVGENDKGLDGIEMVLDKEIRGDVRKFRLTTDRNNIPIFESTLEQILPDKQRSVRLTIDSTIQYVAERGLDMVVQRSHPTGASVIIMNPKTGEILAMASRPTFDPNHYGKGNSESYKNRAVVNMYEPGSTFKPIVASSAVAAGTWDVNKVYNDVGYINVDDRQIRNWDDSGMGRVTLKEILKFSINTGMANIGLHTGGEILTEYARKYGFGKPTGIELPGEGTGILFDPATMSRVDVATMSIGQGVAVTPLQMVQAFGALANGGHMMKPHVIKEIDNADGTIYKQTEPEEVGTPIPEDVSHTISAILEEEVSSGGGQNAKIEGYQFCGKTGTAQRLNSQGTGYAEGQYIGSFVGFGPYDDPEYVVLIVVDNPSGTYYGAQVAAPIFQDMMTQIVRIKGIRPTTITKSASLAKKKTPAVERELPDVVRNSDGILLPNFLGWDNREVNDWLDKAGLGFVPNGTGRAVYQSPGAGKYVDPGTDVDVTFMR
jgi:cell division protein FtsI (penicillin-binding protein 3)/stage V sporulation protein D (sporulation-specific penicillin-binding protein)